MNKGFNSAANKAGVKPSCFVAGTLVMAVAGMVAIENIKAGDKVISTDPETMETAEKTVLETYIRDVTILVRLTVNGEEIITTVDHPFYVKDKGFVNAGELKIGDELVDSNSNVFLVESYNIELTDEPVKVYNFQVEDFHTYHVGECGVLVHNAGKEYGKQYSPEQQELVKEGKAISKENCITRSKAEDYVNRCRAAGLGKDKVRIDPPHPNRMNPSKMAEGVSGKPHLHVPSGKNSHVEIID